MIKKIITLLVKISNINNLITRFKLLFKNNISVGKGVFNQKNIFYNKGKIKIDDGFSIGYKYGGDLNLKYVKYKQEVKMLRY